MAEEVDEFGIPIRKKPTQAQPDLTDDYGIPIKKKTLDNAVDTGSSLSTGGLNSFLSSPPPNVLYAPITDPQLRQETRNRDIQVANQQAKSQQELSTKLNKIRTELPDDAKANWDNVTNLAAQRPVDNLREPSKEELDHIAFMQTPLGKTLGTVAYLGSKATKGTLQIAKGTSWLMNKAGLGGAPTQAAGEIINDLAYDKADEAANFGLTKSDESKFDQNKITSNLGGLAEFLPAIAAGGPTFYLQGMGMGKESADEAEKNGVKINQPVKDAYILGTGIANGLLMKVLGEGVFGKIPASLRSDIAGKISMDAIKGAGDKELTGEQFQSLINDGVKNWGDKLQQTGLSALKGYNKAVVDLSTLAGTNFALKKGVDVANDNPVFNESLGDLAANVSSIATEQAPFFAGLGEVKNVGKLVNYSDYKNSVVEELMKDPSAENVDRVKQSLYEHGFDQTKQYSWTPEEMDATFKQVDNIADVARKLPRGLKADKQVQAVDLINGRNELQQQLKAEQTVKQGLDESVRDIPTANEQLLTDKIEQANDKLKAIATNKPVTYSKEVDPETKEETYYKKFQGQEKEEISESRYDLENTERESRTQSNEQSIESPPTEGTIPETPQTNETGVPETVGEKPIETTENNINVEPPPIEVSKPEINEPTNAGTIEPVTTEVQQPKTEPTEVIKTEETVSKGDKGVSEEKPIEITSPQIEIPELKTRVPEKEVEEVNPILKSEDGITHQDIIDYEQSKANQPVGDGGKETGVLSETVQTAEPNKGTDAGENTKRTAVREETVKPKEAPAIKNENTKERAENAGIELDDHVGQTRSKEVVDKEATKKLKDGYDSHELVRKVLENGHIPNDIENVILAKHTATVEKNYQDLTKRLESEGATISKREFDDLSKEHEQAAIDLDNAFNADVKSGTAQGRALQSRKFDAKNNFSLAQMIKNKRAAVGGEKLSPEQVADVTKRFNEIDEANKKLQERVDKLEADVAKGKAERNIKRLKEGEERLKRKAVTKEALAEDRKKIAADFSAKLKEMRSQGLNDVFKASAEFLTAAAPYVAKMVRNLALEGVTEIKDVVARVKEELSLDELTDREVTDLIGGVYNEKKGTRADVEKQIQDLKTQARLLSQIEDAEAGLAKSKTPKPKVSEKVKELRQRLDELQKGEPQSKEEISLKQSKTAIQKRIAELERRIAERDFSKPEPNEVKQDQELLDLRRKADRLKDEYGLQLAKDELANRTKIEKLKDDLLNIGSLPRALKASLDFSAVLRQGLFLTPHLKQSGTALKEMFGQTFSEEKYKNWISDLKHTPMYDLMQKSDLYLSDKNNHKLLAREEEFTSNLAEKIPIIGPAIEASERAYTSYLNALRAGVFTSEAQKLIERGYTFENNPQEFKSLAKVINVLSGRGDLPEGLVGKNPKILSAALFSPRFMAARIQTLYLWADPRLTKNARILAAKDIGKTLASVATILTMASLAGYTVVHDPRSTNFLKIQDKQEKGTTYYDIAGGLAQYVRFLTQQLLGQKIPLKGNGIVTFGSKKSPNVTRLSEAATFMRGKLSPLVGSAFNLMAGKDVVGQPYHLWPNVPMEFIPLPYTDVKEAYDVGGITNGLKALLPSQFGIGTSSYDPNKKTKK